MQTLYALEAQQETPKTGEAERILQKHFDHTRQLFVYLVYFLTELARYAETDSKIRSAKHLPSDQDRNVNIKIAGNELLWRILSQESFTKALALDKPQLLMNRELLRRLYQELAETEEYRKYISLESREKKSEREMLQFMFNDLMLANETFEGHIEELFTNWADDADMLNQLIQGFLSKPPAVDFQEMLSPEKWDFAKGLLLAVLTKKTVTMDMIKPKLKNWDAERIATLDMILMEMGVCEFLFFETIPPKVTINEYIDLAKEYSTVQSGQFVNGLLDSIHKELTAEKKIIKKSFKNSTL